MGFTDQTSPTVSYSASDSVTGINTTFIEVQDGSGNVIKNSSSTSVSLSDLADGDYQVHYSVEDNVGNTNSGNWIFTVDTSYNGDTAPSVSPQPQVFRVDGEQVRFTVNLSEENEASDIKVLCMNDQSTIVETGFQAVNDYELYYCDIDSSNYRDISIDLKVQMQDRAGNAWTSSIGEYTFDFTPPSFGNLSTPVNVFNDDFNVDFEGGDAASGIQTVHYQVDSSEFSLSQGQNVSVSNGFQVSVDGMASGDHTVYAWAQDGADRWSDRASIDFTYLPNANPKVDVSAPREVRVTAGHATEVNVNVTNTGQLLVKDLKVKAEADMLNATRTVQSLTPESVAKIGFVVNTDKSDLGSHELDVYTENPASAETVNLVVEATEEQQQSIQSKFEEFKSKYKDLNSNVTELMQKLNDERAAELRSNYSEFNSTLTAAIKAQEKGQYYKVDALLANVSDKYESAKTSYQAIEKEHAKAVRNKYIGLFLLLVVLGAGGAIGYFIVLDDEYYLDIEELKELEFIDDIRENGLNTDPFVDAYHKLVDYLREEEQEAEEYVFEGFN
ncbi:MAG: hypothetical protein ABEJ69_01250 [Candidatus Nanohaloarchaea archaeon]